MRQRGQALVEFALVSMLFLTLVFGIIDFGNLFASRVNAYGATRIAARFGATHPTAWTAAVEPAAGTIEGKLNPTSAGPEAPNDDAHITITYLVPGPGAAVLCGTWRVASAAFVPEPGYTQATCVVAGNLIRVRAVYLYGFITPLLHAAFPPVSITTDATARVEV